MSKALEELSVIELRRELRSRQMDPKGLKAELQDRLQSWILDQGQDPEEYSFVDPFQKEMREGFLSLQTQCSEIKEVIQTSLERVGTDMKSEIDKLRNSLGIEIKALKSVPGETVKEGSLNKAATSYQLEETPKSTEDTTPAGTSALYPIATLVLVETRTEEMVNGSTLGESKVLLPWSEESGKELTDELGETDGAENLAEINCFVVDMDSPIEEPHRRVDNVANKNNNELRKNLANINEFTPVSGEPVPCPIASLVSVEKKTEVIIEGEVEPPCVEESVGELDLGDSGERFELEVAEFNSAVDVVQIEAAYSIAAGGDINSEMPKAGKVKSMPVDRVCEVLSSDGYVDSVTLLNPEFRTEPLGGGAEDPVVATYDPVDLRKSSVAEIRVEPHELLVLLFIMFSNFIGMTFGTGGDPPTEESLVHWQSKDSVPRVKMKKSADHGKQSVRDEQI